MDGDIHYDDYRHISVKIGKLFLCVNIRHVLLDSINETQSFETTKRVKKANASMMNRIICFELINVLFSNYQLVYKLDRQFDWKIVIIYAN